MTQACPSLRCDVVALFVDPRGPYPSLVRDWFDADRDARTFDGNAPVVAHPPCGPWSSLRTLSKETTRWCARFALDVVRSNGGAEANLALRRRAAGAASSGAAEERPDALV